MKALSLSQPHAIIMVGIPGSGKTHFAKKFSDTFNAPMVSLDYVVPHAKDFASAGSLIEQQLTELLKTNQSIILEVNTSTRQNRTELAKLLREAGYAALFVWVQTDKETARKRYARMSPEGSPDFEESIKHFSPPHEKEHPLVVSGKHTYASQAKVVLSRLSTPRRESTQIQQPQRRGTIRIQ